MQELEYRTRQLLFFKKKGKTIILFFDQDNFGKKAADKTSERMRMAGVGAILPSMLCILLLILQR
ncbi:MAG: toprim domain-containing protein [Ruminococcus sp.]|nr:toprim domain-containing protein [Ruminococcus sp.]